MADPGGGDSLSESAREALRALRKRDVGIQFNGIKSRSRVRTCCYSLLWMGAVGIVFVAVLAQFTSVSHIIDRIFFPNDFVVGPEIMQDLGMEGVSLFKQHDRDNDGFLSIDEFEPIAHRILQINDTSRYELPLEEWDDIVTVTLEFEPLQLETMSKNKDEMDEPVPLDPLHGLRYWRSPVTEWKNLAASHLRPFLPSDAQVTETVGEVYDLVPVYNDGLHTTLSSNRYLPPPLSSDAEIMVHRLLAMVHPRPFVYSRFGPQGSTAVVRAKNKLYVDIVFRIHAEFQLNDPPFAPFWFTPAQFTGHVTLAKDGGRVLAFHLYVPTDKRLNVDMEWLTGSKQDNMEVDIGYMSRLSLRATGPSVQAMSGGEDQREHYLATPDDDQQAPVEWDEEITFVEAASKLEKNMYPFKEVTYYNLTTAHSVAATRGLLVHSILLWGALDDQSC